MNEYDKLSEKAQKFEEGVLSEKAARPKEWENPPKNVEAFRPEGRVQVRLHKPEIELERKKEVCYVDTLAMQTKLGVKNRAVEQSMSMRDSEIVKARNIMSGTPFMMMGGGTAILVSPSVRMRGRANAQALDPQGSPIIVDIVGAEKAREAERKFWESPERQSPLPKASQVLPAEMPVPQRPVAQVPAAEAPMAAVVLTVPIPDPLPVVPPAVVISGTVKVEETVDLKKKVEENIALLERVEDLEIENAALLQIVARLAAENKTLKAKK
jgi:hypothetical protein